MPETNQRTKMRPSETLAEYAKRLKEIGKKPLIIAVDEGFDPNDLERIRDQSIMVSQSQGDKDADDFGEQVIVDAMEGEPPYEGRK